MLDHLKPFKIALIIIMSLIILTSLCVVEAAPIKAGVEVHVSGPQEIFVNQTYSYEVEIGGSFSQRAFNWSLEVLETPGMEIIPSSSQSNTTNIFTVNVTAKRAGDMTITFKGFCSDFEEVRYGESTLEIKALKPGTIKVDVTNPTDIDLKRVKVGVFIDNELKGSTEIPSLKSGETKHVSINWSRENLERGEHTLEIWVDYGFQDIDSFIKDEMILEHTVYVKGESTLSRYTLPISLAIVGGIVAAFFYYARKKRQRRRPW